MPMELAFEAPEFEDGFAEAIDEDFVEGERAVVQAGGVNAFKGEEELVEGAFGFGGGDLAFEGEVGAEGDEAGGVDAGADAGAGVRRDEEAEAGVVFGPTAAEGEVLDGEKVGVGNGGDGLGGGEETALAGGGGGDGDAVDDVAGVVALVEGEPAFA